MGKLCFWRILGSSLVLIGLFSCTRPVEVSRVPRPHPTGIPSETSHSPVRLGKAIPCPKGNTSLGEPVASRIDDLPVPEVAQLTSFTQTPPPQKRTRNTVFQDLAEYDLPPDVDVVDLQQWYLKAIPSGQWKNWDLVYPREDETQEPCHVDYAWTHGHTCLTFYSNVSYQNIGLRLEKSNAELCLQ